MVNREQLHCNMCLIHNGGPGKPEPNFLLAATIQEITDCKVPKEGSEVTLTSVGQVGFGSDELCAPPYKRTHREPDCSGYQQWKLSMLYLQHGGKKDKQEKTQIFTAFWKNNAKQQSQTRCNSRNVSLVSPNIFLNQSRKKAELNSEIVTLASECSIF